MKQVRRSVEVYQGAAKVLLEAGYCGQAVARAYYALHAVCEHVADQFKGTVLWPDDQGKPADRYFHAHVPTTVRAIVAAQIAQKRTTSVITADQAYTEALQLVKARMEGDYRAYLPVSRDVAAKRILVAQSLCHILLEEAEFVARQARTKAQSQGTTQQEAGGSGAS